MDKIQFQFRIADEQHGVRLDQSLVQLLPQYSRSTLQTWIKKGFVHVNGETRRAKDKVTFGELIEIVAEVENTNSWVPESTPIPIVYEDEDLLIINKSANWVVHPAVGHRRGTLVNALLHYCPQLSELPRAGIVHRLDKDTTGLMMVAKTLNAQQQLTKALQQRKIKREYEAIVHGVLVSGGTIDLPIGRHPRDRKKMAVVNLGKPAITHYRVLERFFAYTHLRVMLETGRTHQIRVHFAHRKHPIVGDQTYGKHINLSSKVPEALRKALQSFGRQALHAKSLSFEHPISKELVNWEIAPPEDFQALLSHLQATKADL